MAESWHRDPAPGGIRRCGWQATQLVRDVTRWQRACWASRTTRGTPPRPPRRLPRPGPRPQRDPASAGSGSLASPTTPPRARHPRRHGGPRGRGDAHVPLTCRAARSLETPPGARGRCLGRNQRSAGAAGRPNLRESGGGRGACAASGRAEVDAPPPRDALPVCCWRKEKGKREELPPPSPAPPRSSRGDRATAPPRLPVAGPASSVSVAPAAACGDRVGGWAWRPARAGCGAGAGGQGPVSRPPPRPPRPAPAVGVRPAPGPGLSVRRAPAPVPAVRAEVLRVPRSRRPGPCGLRGRLVCLRGRVDHPARHRSEVGVRRGAAACGAQEAGEGTLPEVSAALSEVRWCAEGLTSSLT